MQMCKFANLDSYNSIDLSSGIVCNESSFDEDSFARSSN